MAERVDAYRHESQRRRNLPTEQTGEFMEDEDREPVRYSPPIRERSGPVLSWDRGADLDRIETDATPLYITEKIHPSAFVEQLRSLSPAPMFGDFNNLPRDAEYQWYEHEGNWQNRLIHGDSVKVMASLLEKEGMAGKVQMIYMDPPYGIGFKSNMQVDTRDRSMKESTEGLLSDPKQVQAFRDAYQNGLHSYLDNLYRNFVHARELLSESGSIFMQIGSENVNRVAMVLDEVFGNENRVAQIAFAKRGSADTRLLPEVADYLLWYAKDRELVKFHQIYEHMTPTEQMTFRPSYTMIEMADGTVRRPTSSERADPNLLPSDARIYLRERLMSQGGSSGERGEAWISPSGRVHNPPPSEHWSVSHDGLNRLAELERLCELEGGTLHYKRYISEVGGRRIGNLWREQMSASDLHYRVETAESAVERCVLMTTSPGDLVMDITCGGGTTSSVAERWGRRWITTDTSPVAVAITRQRLLAGTYDWYHLQDSAEGAERERRLSNSSITPPPPSIEEIDRYGNDPAQGFVYERVPRVSAAILAYDQEVEPILLVNRPLVKKGIVRVSSPFTVESHSPWRYVDPAEAADTSETAVRTRESLLEGMQVAGIQQPGGGRLLVDDVADWDAATDSGSRITHRCLSGVEGEGTKQTAICIVPDDQTASQELIEIVAAEANRRRMERLLIVAFAFAPNVYGEGATKRGRLEILTVHANRDFQIPGLKNEPDDSSFVIVGRPEIQLAKHDANHLIVEVLGYDTFNPLTGNVDGAPADDPGRGIDCWMIDTDYDGKSFNARRIHLPNSQSDKRIQRFQRQLGKLIDPALWESMQSTKSAPFEIPKRDQPRIAVRIITRTGIEMTVERDISEFAE